MTAASPHPAEPFMNWAVGFEKPSGDIGSGAKMETLPSGHWLASRSRSHFAVKPATS